MLSIVLARRDFRESDQIISLYTLERGKVEVLARGVKKITSKNSAHLEPFSLIEAEIISGKDLSHLGAVQSINYFVNIRQDLQKSLSASFIVSLMDRILHVNEVDERVFDLLLHWLEYLNGSEFSVRSSQFLLDAFVVKLLNCLGLDITQIENVSETFKKDLSIMNNGGWEKITNYQLPITNYSKLHNYIYKYIQFQLERKIDDWNGIY